MKKKTRIIFCACVALLVLALAVAFYFCFLRPREPVDLNINIKMDSPKDETGPVLVHISGKSRFAGGKSVDSYEVLSNSSGEAESNTLHTKVSLQGGKYQLTFLSPVDKDGGVYQVGDEQDGDKGAFACQKNVRVDKKQGDTSLNLTYRAKKLSDMSEADIDSLLSEMKQVDAGRIHGLQQEEISSAMNRVKNEIAVLQGQKDQVKAVADARSGGKSIYAGKVLIFRSREEMLQFQNCPDPNPGIKEGPFALLELTKNTAIDVKSPTGGDYGREEAKWICLSDSGIEKWEAYENKQVLVATASGLVSASDTSLPQGIARMGDSEVIYQGDFVNDIAETGSAVKAKLEEGRQAAAKREQEQILSNAHIHPSSGADQTSLDRFYSGLILLNQRGELHLDKYDYFMGYPLNDSDKGIDIKNTVPIVEGTAYMEDVGAYSYVRYMGVNLVTNEIFQMDHRTGVWSKLK